LKDAEASISCVLFRSYAQNLGFRLKDGQNVLVFGDVEIYRPRGQVQIVAKGIKLDSGMGLRHQELERLKERLAKEGLFDSERKRVLPRYPQRIGIVTSPNGAALRDVLRVMGTYPAKIILSPAQVQGEGASESVAASVRALRGKADVVIVCRGGGSAEDLWPFNTEAVARAIFECDAPVISAVGHETDVTLADFVADLRAPTPTAAAEMAVPDLQALKDRISGFERRLLRILGGRLDQEEARLDYLRRSLSSRRMYSLVSEHRQRLDYLGERFLSAGRAKIQGYRQQLSSLESRLSAVSPLATLSRGYSLAKVKGELLMRARDVDVGEDIELILQDGWIECSVKARHL
jgi:exodeoxyribonuclease VII large subunit